jgi:hypothetical protein
MHRIAQRASSAWPNDAALLPNKHGQAAIRDGVSRTIACRLSPVAAEFTRHSPPSRDVKILSPSGSVITAQVDLLSGNREGGRSSSTGSGGRYMPLECRFTALVGGHFTVVWMAMKVTAKMRLLNPQASCKLRHVYLRASPMTTPLLRHNENQIANIGDASCSEVRL